MIGLTFDSIDGIVEKLQKEQIFNESVPCFKECRLDKLASCLKTPFQRQVLSESERDFCQKASLLFCFLIENHPFPNANKRIAVVSLITLADINGFRLDIQNIRLYAIAMAVTMLSKYGLFKEAINEVEQVIKSSLELKPGKPLNKRERNQLEIEFKNFLNNTEA